MKKFFKWTGGLLAIVIFLALIGYIFRETLLTGAGHFMAPTGDYTADVVILEGSDYIRTGFVHLGIDLIASGKVQKMIVVVHRIAPAHRPFGIRGDYPDVVGRKLKEMGLRDDQFKIIVTPIRQPVTLQEARTVLGDLAKDNIGSAILIAPSFHTRRSYLAYAYVGGPLKIEIYPRASFTESQREKWWTDPGARRDMAAETIKLLYYLAAGHIPLKFSYRTEGGARP
ncbi:MAG: hypothetical protein R6W75_05105 [Smithellaceae bacterium]